MGRPRRSRAFVRADRDHEDGLAAAAHRPWDAIIDLSRQPGQVRRATRDLTGEHWVFVSTGNVYARFDRLEQDESAPLLDPLAGDVMADMEQYGAAKVACEDAIRAAAATSTVVRSGLIGGPGDASGRTGYYPWRFAHPTGPEVLVPPDLDFPCALIDVDDLAGWIVHAARARLDGAFNATGPTTPLGEVLALAQRVAVGTASPRPVPGDVLAEAGVSSWMGPRSLPLWIDDSAWRWFATMDTTAAREQGLISRPLGETLARTLEYEERRDQPRQAGLTDDDEVMLRQLLTDR